MWQCVNKTAVLVVLVAVLAAGGLAASPVHAASPAVNLVLGGTGSVPWNITNIKPGDRGTEMLTLRNDGTASGVLTVWVSDIVDSQSEEALPAPVDPDEPWELSQHVLFEPVNSRISATINLPATLLDFPQSASDTARITVSPISSGETIDLVWEWYLPKTAGNAVQGSTLSFSLHYTLTEITVSSGGNGGSQGGAAGGDEEDEDTEDKEDSEDGEEESSGDDTDFTFIITTPEKQTSMTVSGNGTIGETRTVDDISDYLIISFERDTRIVTEDNTVPRELEVTFRETAIPDAPPGTVIVGPVYELLFYTDDGTRSVTLSKPARIVLNYLMETVPEYVKTLFIASYDEENGWTQLQPVSGLVTGEGQLGALVNHFTLFTILGVIEEEEVATPALDPSLPASFETNNLSLSVDQVESGESTTVRVHVVNTGGLSGEYLLTLKVNGFFLESQLVRLEPGQDKNVSFVLSTFEPGTYEIDVNGLQDTLEVLEGPLSDSGISLLRYWPMPAVPILVGAGVLIVGTALLFVFSRKRG